jgi:hypothetical protein
MNPSLGPAARVTGSGRRALPCACLLLLAGGCLADPSSNQIAGLLGLSSEREEVVGSDAAVELRCTDGRQTLYRPVGSDPEGGARYSDGGDGLLLFELALESGTWACDATANSSTGDWFLGALRPAGATCLIDWPQSEDQPEEPYFFAWSADAAVWLGPTVADGSDACPSETPLQTLAQTAMVPEGIFCGTASVTHAVTPSAISSGFVGWTLIPCFEIQTADDGSHAVRTALYHALEAGVDFVGCAYSGVIGPVPVVLDLGGGIGFTTDAPSLDDVPGFTLSAVLWPQGMGYLGRFVVEFTAADSVEYGFVIEVDGTLERPTLYDEAGNPHYLDDFPERLGGNPDECVAAL